MTAQNNDYIYEIMGNQGYTFGDDIFIPAGAVTTQTDAIPLKSQCHRVIKNNTASAALAMRSILSNDNQQLVMVINDDPTNAVVVFPFKGGTADTAETINGVSTGFTVGAATAAIFFASLAQTKRKGSNVANPLNWSANTLS